MAERLVSIVIPVRNEATGIRATVESIVAQDYSGDIEVVIADGMSTDGTRDILDQISAKEGRVRFVDNPSGRTPNGLNIAISASRGDVIVRCDGHAELPPNYVSLATEILDTTGAVNVGGIQDAIGSKPMQRAIAYAMSSPIGVGNSRFHYGGDPGPVDTVYLGVFRRDALVAAGLFDESLTRNQDYELNIRLRDNGGVVWFDPRLRVVYRPRRSLRSLWTQYFQYGTWKRRVLRMHPESTKLRQLIPPLFVIGMGVSAVLAFTPLRSLAVVVPGLYLAMLAGATMYQLIKTRDPAALLFPAAIATMHLSWGVGFLSGR
ncbi:MAG: glycosyltransferase family 2 protein [Acidimicrobiia bacterium]|nr:glycosyltransferase family 2 protein [Acidimicrobiia bacterium]MDX2467400.1 glycosyltransferase family 2 protein [Acidimicrobiia bacterium]